MLKSCVKLVDKFRTSLVKLAGLCPKSTVLPKYLTSQVFFKRGLSAGFEQLLDTYKQPGWAIFNPLFNSFYTLTTGPITTTNLIKE